MYTKPKHEKKIAERLRHFNIEYFLPLIKTCRMLNGRKKITSVPLFPSYIFTKPDSAQSYLESLSIPGVFSYLKCSNQISKVNQNVIDKLKAFVLNDADEVIVTSEQLKPGTILNIKSGPLRGNMCEIIDYKGKAKLLVRIEILRRNVLVDLPSNCLISNQSLKASFSRDLPVESKAYN